METSQNDAQSICLSAMCELGKMKNAKIINKKLIARGDELSFYPISRKLIEK